MVGLPDLANKNTSSLERSRHLFICYSDLTWHLVPLAASGVHLPSLQKLLVSPQREGDHRSQSEAQHCVELQGAFWGFCPKCSVTQHVGILTPRPWIEPTAPEVEAQCFKLTGPPGKSSNLQISSRFLRGDVNHVLFPLRSN